MPHYFYIPMPRGDIAPYPPSRKSTLARSPVRIPKPDLKAEIADLLNESPENVADSSRNYVRLYVRDLQAAVKQMMGKP
jgi:hypothetical protein